MLQESINALQYLQISLSYHLSFRPLFCLFLKCSLRQVLMYVLSFPLLPNFYPNCLQHSSSMHLFSIRVKNSVDPDPMASSQCFQKWINPGSAEQGLIAYKSKRASS